MVMGDTSFTTVTGEEISRTSIIQNMIDFYNDKYPNAFITDFNEGSVIRNILESFAVEEYHILRVDNDINKVAFISTAIGNYLDLHGKDMNAPRSNGKQAWGTVTFSMKGREKSSDGSILIYFEVRDTGIGIKESDMAKLFESFERLDVVRNRNIEGTGLGMTITRKLLDLMGSELVVESEYNVGSTFSFDLWQKIEDETLLGDYK